VVSERRSSALKRGFCAVFLALVGLSGLISSSSCQQEDSTEAFRNAKRTVQQVRDLANALSIYRIEKGHLPPVRELVVPGTSCREVALDMSRGAQREEFRRVRAWPLERTSALPILLPMLAPYLPKSFESTDARGGTILVGFTEDLKSFTLLSTGSDGKVDPDHVSFWEPVEDWRDIIWVDTCCEPSVGLNMGFASKPSGIAGG